MYFSAYQGASWYLPGITNYALLSRNVENLDPRPFWGKLSAEIPAARKFIAFPCTGVSISSTYPGESVGRYVRHLHFKIYPLSVFLDPHGALVDWGMLYVFWKLCRPSKSFPTSEFSFLTRSLPSLLSDAPLVMIMAMDCFQNSFWFKLLIFVKC